MLQNLINIFTEFIYYCKLLTSYSSINGVGLEKLAMNFGVYCQFQHKKIKMKIFGKFQIFRSLDFILMCTWGRDSSFGVGLLLNFRRNQKWRLHPKSLLYR